MKKKKLNIGIAFSSMDRYENTRLALESLVRGIDHEKQDVTLLWQDGSTETDSRRFFESFRCKGVSLEKHGSIRGIGAAHAIARGMNDLFARKKFDWLGTVGSDVYLEEDWLSECLKAAAKAKTAGLNPGIITPYVLDHWVVENHQAFNLMWGCGAAGSLFTPGAWSRVPPVDIGHHFPSSLLTRFGFPETHATARPLGYDWSFGPSVYHAGFDVIGTRQAMLLNCGITPEAKPHFLSFHYVEKTDKGAKVKLGERDYDRWVKALRDVAPIQGKEQSVLNKLGRYVKGRR